MEDMRRRGEVWGASAVSYSVVSAVESYRLGKF